MCCFLLVWFAVLHTHTHPHFLSSLLISLLLLSFFPIYPSLDAPSCTFGLALPDSLASLCRAVACTVSGNRNIQRVSQFHFHRGFDILKECYFHLFKEC